MYRVACAFWLGWLFYRALAVALRWLCGRHWVLQRFSAGLRPIRQFLADAQLTGVEADRVVADALMLHLWSRIWGVGLTRLRPADFASICRVEGFEAVLACLADGGGVICAHHHAQFVHSYWTWLAGTAYASSTVFVPVRGADRYGYDAMKANAVALRQSTLALRAGELVNVVPDGVKGKQGIEHDFFGRLRGFQPGFAELALAAPAPVVPVCVIMDTQGRLLIRFGVPFQRDSGATTHHDAVLHLVEQYVAFLREAWRGAPANIGPGALQTQLNFPLKPSSE
ncbi:MAG: hypothetical protein IPK16_16375 [Anaerolineales bacterium]|nr:hypothetical protein [Anaerolineales bacterium]